MGVTSGIKTNLIKQKIEPIQKQTTPTPQPIGTDNNGSAPPAGTAFKQAELNFTGQQTRLALNNSFNGTVLAKRSVSGNVDQDKVDHIRDRIINADNLAIVVNPGPEFEESLLLNEAERNRLIGDIIRGDSRRAEQLLLDHSFADVRNATYDSQEIVAGAVADAYASGDVSDADLNQFLADIGEERASEFVLSLNADAGNVFPGGVVEAVGEQAEALGYDETAALAFTSSDSLIRRHLPDDASQEAAFEHVQEYIDNHIVRSDTGLGTNGFGGDIRAEFTFAVANAARLTSKGNGYSQSEFDNLLQQIGPSLTNEVIARSSSVVGDRGPNGAVETLGRASARIAEKSDGDDQRRWEVNQYTAFTQNSNLIHRNLPTEADRLEAFDVLNRELARSRDDVDDALEDGFTLLSHPIEANGLAQLLGRHGEEIFDAKLGESGTNYEGQADLVNALQSTLYSPIIDQQTANRIRFAIGNYIEDAFTAGGNGDVRAGERIGALIGLHDVAFQRAFEAASTPEGRSRLEQLQVDVAKTILSKAASTLLAPTGPVGSTAGGFVVKQLLNELFKDRSPSAGQLGQEFLNLLEENGIDIQDASNYRDNLVEVVNVISEGLQTQLSDLQDIENPTTEQQRQIDDIQSTLQLLGDLESNFRDRALETEDEYDDVNGKLREALNDWE